MFEGIDMETNQVNRSTVKTKAGLEKAVDLLTNGNVGITLLEDALVYYNNGQLANSADIHLGQRVADPLPLQNGTASKGSGSALAMSNHVHPNTCGTPTQDDHQVNKQYVDNFFASPSNGIRFVNSGIQILLSKTQASIGSVVKITGDNVFTETTSGTTPDYSPIAVVASEILTGNVQWYSVSGLAYVAFTSPPTAGQIARLSKTGDTGAANGKATGVSMFSPPSGSDDHWSEIGHVVSGTPVNGLYPVILHFN
jgi:hypothetical protein